MTDLGLGATAATTELSTRWQDNFSRWALCFGTLFSLLGFLLLVRAFARPSDPELALLLATATCLLGVGGTILIEERFFQLPERIRHAELFNGMIRQIGGRDLGQCQLATALGVRLWDLLARQELTEAPPYNKGGPQDVVHQHASALGLDDHALPYPVDPNAFQYQFVVDGLQGRHGKTVVNAFKFGFTVYTYLANLLDDDVPNRSVVKEQVRAALLELGDCISWIGGPVLVSYLQTLEERFRRNDITPGDLKEGIERLILLVENADSSDPAIKQLERLVSSAPKLSNNELQDTLEQNWRKVRA